MRQIYSAICLILISLPLASCNSAESENSRASNQCSKREVVFDSNQSGTFGIYKVCEDNLKVTKLVDLEQTHEVYPHPSPDGKKIVFAKAKQPHREALAEVWTLDLLSNKQELITTSGTFPSYSADGSKIYFARNRAEFLEFDLSTKVEKKIFPWPGSGFEGKQIAKPRVSEDSNWLYFTSEVPNRWNAWRVNLSTKEAERIGHGCQPSSFADSDEPIWIKKRQSQDASDIMRFNRETKKSEMIHSSGVKTFAYYPEVSGGGEELLYSACRCHKKKNTHEKGNYELTLADLKTAKTIRLTNNGSTNRWPKFIPKRQNN